MSSSVAARPKLTFRQISTNGRVAAALALGFASGLPFNLPQGTLQAWLSTTSVSLKTIGWFTLVGIPYALKFLWAPLLDRYSPPFLGRRRGWIVLFQAALAIAIAALALQTPPAALPRILALGFLVVFLSASQDIVIDAYRTDTLRPVERGLGSSATQLGYRAALYVTGAFALLIAAVIGWHATYLLMAGVMAGCIALTLAAPEPERHIVAPRSLAEAVVEPLKELLARPGMRALLLLVVLYKFGDAFALTLWSPFLIRGVGFTIAEVGGVAKVTMIVSTLMGALVGGVLFARLGLYRSLLIFGTLQALSNLLYSLLASVGHDLPTMVLAVGFDQFAGGLGSAAAGALLMAMCDVRFSAFQFALLSSLAAIPRNFLGPVAGALVEGAEWHGVVIPALGWQRFFVLTTLTGLPAVALVWWLRARIRALDNGSPV
jgi:PAT family beta-lactamase induction signal transducer AmpG